MAGFDLSRSRKVLAEYEEEVVRLQHVEDFLHEQIDSIQRERYRAEDKVRAYRVAIEEGEKVPNPPTREDLFTNG